VFEPVSGFAPRRCRVAAVRWFGERDRSVRLMLGSQPGSRRDRWRGGEHSRENGGENGSG